MTSTSVINLGPTNGPEIESFAIQTIKQIEDGEYSALELFIKCKAFQKSIDLIIQGIEESALTEAEREGKSFSKYNASVSIRELGTKWFYDKTNDPTIAEILDEKAEITEKEKDRQKFLKALKTAIVVMNEETGELIQVFPPRKESKTGLVISF